MNILVVDDDPALRDMIRTVLDMWEIKCCVSSSGYEALLHLERHPEICMMLTDIRMPGMDGVELARRAHEIRPDLRIVAMSGNATSIEELGKDIDNLLAKPFNLAQLGTLMEPFLVPATV